MNLIKIVTVSDAKETLKERAESDDKIRGVIILELLEDGTQKLATSAFSQQEKCYLKCFFDSQISQWFNAETD